MKTQEYLDILSQLRGGAHVLARTVLEDASNVLAARGRYNTNASTWI